MADFSSAAPGSVPQRRSLLQRLRRWLQPGASPQPRQPGALRPNGMFAYLGEICLFPYDFVPKGWLPCNGQSLSVAQNPELYSLIGNTYGGNAQNFNLPDMRGRVAVGTGLGPGLTGTYAIGSKGGVESVTLSSAHLPTHTHTVGASTLPGTASAPQGNVPADSGTGSAQYTQATTGLVTPPAASMTSTGRVADHSNIQPYLAIPYCIAVVGIYPSSN